MKFTTQVAAVTDGTPYIQLHGNQLQIFPTGIYDACFYVKIDDWRELNRAVEQAITMARVEHVHDHVDGTT